MRPENSKALNISLDMEREDDRELYDLLEQEADRRRLRFPAQAAREILHRWRERERKREERR